MLSCLSCIVIVISIVKIFVLFATNQSSNDFVFEKRNSYSKFKLQLQSMNLCQKDISFYSAMIWSKFTLKSHKEEQTMEEKKKKIFLAKKKQSKDKKKQKKRTKRQSICFYEFSIDFLFIKFINKFQQISVSMDERWSLMYEKEMSSDMNAK